MCGIAGILDPTGVDERQVRRMADALAHRGPDDSATYVEPGIGFGFRRLSIIDVEGGGQPISNEDGSVRVVFNGEIYNYRKLRADLISRGHRFRTTGDTEVLVHLYEERGADLLRVLRGMFAFAIWDAGRQRLLLARDHMGQKPLYWARDGSRSWFASELKAILAVQPSFRSMSARALDEYLSLRFISEDRSMFEGVHKLPPGHMLELGASGNPTPRRYWNLEYEPKLELDERDAIEALDEKLRETVQLHLVSDVEVGSFLSGGIDSGLVTAIAADLTQEPLQTFSLSTPHGSFDELPAARSVAERYSTRFQHTSVTPDDICLIPRLVAQLDEPSDPLSVCTWRIAELASRSVKVCLGGDGGDELFGGYDRYYGIPAAAAWSKLPRVIRVHVAQRLADLVPSNGWYKDASNQVRWLNSIADVEPDQRFVRSLSWLFFSEDQRALLYSDEFLAEASRFDPCGTVSGWIRTEEVDAHLDRLLKADLFLRLPNHPVMILDRMTMAHGLEGRSPFLDHELAEFVATLPASYKVRGRQRRYIQTKLAERYLPPEVLRRPKQGFSAGLPSMFQDSYRRLFDYYVPRSRLVAEGVFRSEGVRRILDEHRQGREDHATRLWLLLFAEFWYRVHIDQMPVEDLVAEMAESALANSSVRVAAGLNPTGTERDPTEEPIAATPAGKGR